jgi:hypothetical protein
MGTGGSAGRRSLKYIRLAAFLADQPPEVERLVMTIDEIETLVGESLPDGSRFPSWWRNDEHRAHSRAWITAGWSVKSMQAVEANVEFVRDGNVATSP